MNIINYIRANVHMYKKSLIIQEGNKKKKKFNTTAVCIPTEHYMVNIDDRLKQIKQLVDENKYFTINRARQYGKTTTLRALYRYLKSEYYVVLMDFQTFGSIDFESEHTFAGAFANSFVRLFLRNDTVLNKLNDLLSKLTTDSQNENFSLRILFNDLKDICSVSDKPIVLMIDEVDSAANNQVFLDFLSQLRAGYIDRDLEPTFKSVILAGVYDIKNLKHKLRNEDEHKYNSPWNIAADFNVDMSFSEKDICGMLSDYEHDQYTGMDIDQMSGLIYSYTSGYPYLVSRICQIMDEKLPEKYLSKQDIWTADGFNSAIRILLSEKNTLFESLSEKLNSYPKLADMLKTLLFTGKTIVYNYYEESINIATMFGFVRDNNGVLVISNRIFETWLYNLYLSTAEMQKTDIYKASLQDKSQFIINGYLDMKHILEKFVIHFHDIFGDMNEKFLEDEGRRYFLLYLRPIINGTGNYYIESHTRDLCRTDIIVDYLGNQYIIEMKIWHGEEYNNRGEKQLIDYLDAYHSNTGYMLSFNFNKKKHIGVHEIIVDDKKIIEAVV